MFKVLIIEKVERLRSIYKEWFLGLEDREIVIELVESGHACIEKLEGIDTYDMVVIDMGLTEFDALTTAKKLRKLGFKKPIIAHTTLGIAEAKEGMMNGAMDGFSIKSHEGKNLLNLLKLYALCLEKKSKPPLNSQKPD